MAGWRDGSRRMAHVKAVYSRTSKSARTCRLVGPACSRSDSLVRKRPRACLTRLGVHWRCMPISHQTAITARCNLLIKPALRFSSLSSPRPWWPIPETRCSCRASPRAGIAQNNFRGLLPQSVILPPRERRPRLLSECRRFDGSAKTGHIPIIKRLIDTFMSTMDDHVTITWIRREFRSFCERAA